VNDWQPSPLLDPARVGGAFAGDLDAVARVVVESDLLRARETHGHPVLGRYRLAERPAVSVLVRHTTPDLGVLDEVFGARIYAPPRSLGIPRRVLDLGGNVGLFGAWALTRWPSAQITSVEPDPHNLDVLERCVAANAGRWRVVAAAASTSAGELRFSAGRFACSAVAEDGTLRVPAVDVLPWLARADLAKVDIEGGEWELLGDPRLAMTGPPALVLEYHPHRCPGADTRAEAVGLLEGAGYVVDAVRARPDGVGMLWAFRAG
jgi:FkbM family methyltransferase